MPYINKEDRIFYNRTLDQMPFIRNKGELEYCVFKLMKLYMSNKEFRYTTLHDCVYATIHAGEEFRRRFLDKREDQAIQENGDIN